MPFLYFQIFYFLILNFGANRPNSWKLTSLICPIPYYNLYIKAIILSATQIPLHCIKLIRQMQPPQSEIRYILYFVPWLYGLFGCVAQKFLVNIQCFHHFFLYNMYKNWLYTPIFHPKKSPPLKCQERRLFYIIAIKKDLRFIVRTQNVHDFVTHHIFYGFARGF